MTKEDGLEEIKKWCLSNIPKEYEHLSELFKLNIMENAYVANLKREITKPSSFLQTHVDLNSYERVLTEFCKEFGIGYSYEDTDFDKRILTVKERLSFYGIRCKVSVSKIDDGYKYANVYVYGNNYFIVVIEISKHVESGDLYVSEVKSDSIDIYDILLLCLKGASCDSITSTFAITSNFDVNIGELCNRVPVALQSLSSYIDAAIFMEYEILDIYSSYNFRYDFNKVFSRYCSILSSWMLYENYKKWSADSLSYNIQVTSRNKYRSLIVSSDKVLKNTIIVNSCDYESTDVPIEFLTIHPILDGLDTGLVKWKFSPFAKDFNSTIVVDGVTYLLSDRYKYESILLSKFI